jgi:hypothetical protein
VPRSGAALDAWLLDIKGFDGTRPRTLTLYKGLTERYVKPVIGNVRLDKLTPAHVQRLVTQTRNSTTSRGKLAGRLARECLSADVGYPLVSRASMEATATAS